MNMYTLHNKMTSPGRHGPALDDLPEDIDSILSIIQGLFVHSDYLHFYHLDEAEYASFDRKTLPLEERLMKIFLANPQPISTARPLDIRELGTCRDYALMACGMLRHKKISARVRCGFATYFSPGRYEDHWICEYWSTEQKRWVRIDAQLDILHCQQLGIKFDPADVPSSEFVTANEAWRLIRNKEFSPDVFGHGDAFGEWFLWVNLARDCLSLSGCETSEWDMWRDAIKLKFNLSDAERKLCGEIEGIIQELEVNHQASFSRLIPFWI